MKGKKLFSILKRLLVLRIKSTYHVPAKIQNKITLRNGQWNWKLQIYKNSASMKGAKKTQHNTTQQKNLCSVLRKEKSGISATLKDRKTWHNDCSVMKVIILTQELHIQSICHSFMWTGESNSLMFKGLILCYPVCVLLRVNS